MRLARKRCTRLSMIRRVFLVLPCLMVCFAPYAHAQMCTREYLPVCGQVPGEPQARTFSNQCLLKAAHAEELQPGACASEPVHLIGGDADAHGCKASAGYVWNDELASCVRPWLSSAVTLEVASKLGACAAQSGLQCLMVREIPPAGQASAHKPKPGWAPLAGQVFGFAKLPGKRYTLRVRKDQADGPPASTSGTMYTLLRVLKEAP